MNDIKMKNHPSCIIDNVIFMAVMVLIFCFTINLFQAYIVGAAVLIIWTIMCVISWNRTTIMFNEKEAVVESNFIYKKKKVIPYSKMASINVVRNIFDRIFGTTRLQFNINSGVNANVPEASFAFKCEVADRIRSELSDMIFNQQYQPNDENSFKSAVLFTPFQVIMHGIFSLSTFSLIYTGILLAYSIVAILMSSGVGLLSAIVLLVIGEVIPVASLIIRYYNFKVYRVEDTIHIQHGAIQTYRSSFDVNRINAIRVKKPFVARLMHKSCLEAEVIGINATTDVRPVLCLLVDDDKVEGLMHELVPEFIYDVKSEKQPPNAKYVLLARATYASIAILLITAYPSYYLYNHLPTFPWITGYLNTILQFALPVLTVFAVLTFYYAAHTSFRVRELSMSADLMTFVNGILDRDIITMQYDRIQISTISAGMTARRYGLAKCKVSLLSANGGTRFASGFFDEEELLRINEIIMERLSNGRYDYRKSGM